MEEANCRGNKLGEMHCGSKRDDNVMEEEEKPDFLDVDNDGNPKESFKDAVEDAEDAKKEEKKQHRFKPLDCQ